MFEGSWDLPRSFQDLEIFGLQGSVYMVNGRVEMRPGPQRRGAAAVEVPIEALPPERAEPIAYMIHAVKSGEGVEGLTAIDINVDVSEIIEAAKP